HLLMKKAKKKKMMMMIEFFENRNLMSHIEQIECGLRLMVPALIGRIKKVQSGFVGRIAEDWSDEGLKGVIGEEMKEEMDDIVSVFVGANRLRKSVIAEIVGTMFIQAALFLEALPNFLLA
ncbi:hypothetical protein CISIN_1g036811mg, partial [Citrus sinensis]